MSQLNVNHIYQQVAKAMGVVAPPLVATYDVANAASDGRRILINPIWAERTLHRYCDDFHCTFAVIAGFLAHELGHHRYGDAYCVDCNRRDQELRADSKLVGRWPSWASTARTLSSSSVN